jgi:phage-related protein
MIDAIEAVHTEWFTEELEALPPDQQARVLRRIDTFERKGWRISAADEDIKELRDNVWELRVIGKGPAYRALFCPFTGATKRFALLTNCVKKAFMKKGKVKEGEITRALSRCSEWLSKNPRGLV